MTAATATATARRRAGDDQIFFSSHDHCYRVGAHAKTAAGRESCRTGQRLSRNRAKAMPLCAHADGSKVVHLLIDDGNTVQCTGKLVSEKWVSVRTEPTCKNCIKKANA